MKKLDILQVYRGIAAILVVLYHVTVYSQEKFNYVFMGNVFSFGFTGVDFFFVLSGFIIFYVHGRDLGQPDTLATYLDRRVKRIFPFYWGVTAVKLAAIFLVAGYAKPYEKEWGVILSSFLLLPQPNLPLIGAAWTLTHEVLFYVFFGIMILLGRRWMLRFVIVWAIAIIGLFAFQSAGLFEGVNYLIGFLLNPRNLEFLLGCASGFIIKNYTLRYARVLALAGAGLFFAAGLVLNPTENYSAMVLMASFGLPAFLLVTGSAWLASQYEIKLPRLLVFLGDASYSIYLGAFAFVNFLSLAFSKISLALILGPFATTFLIALFAVGGGSLVYILVERPLLTVLRKKQLISQWAMAPSFTDKVR
ncbi:MAG: acyltransferase [Anaerolineae bacterium]